MNTFVELLEAIEAYSDAKAAYNKAKEGARSSYFYSREENDRDRTKKRFEEALEAHIRSVVAKPDCHICEESGPGSCQ